MHNADILAAAPDALAAALGVPRRNPHPMADDLKFDTLSKLAYAYGLAVRPQQTSEPDRAVQARGMSSAEFGRALAGAADTLAVRRFDDVATHRIFCGIVEARDFKPVPTSIADSGLDLPSVGELGEITHGVVNVTNSGTAQLSSYARVLSFSRESVINDETDLIGRTIANQGAAGARTEAKLVYELMEANPALDDGELVFQADHGNLVAAALDGTNLATAMAALRNQQTAAGNRADLPARHLVVEPALEYPALKLAHEAGLPLTVTASSRLPSGRWFLMADPSLSPNISVLRLRGAANSVRVDEVPPRIGFDGLRLRVVARLAAVFQSRIGIVRGGA